MCFSEAMSWSFTVLGFGGAAFIYRYIPNMYFIAHTIAYFAIMELTQALTYRVLDDCNPWNKFYTIIGGLHICFQPLVTNFMASNEYYDKPIIRERFLFVCRLSALFGIWMFARSVVEIYGITKSIVPDSCTFTYATETLRGTDLCSYRAKYHMGWHFPMADNHYWWPSMNLHCFLSFGPMLVHLEDYTMVIKAFILMLTGPILAAWFTDDTSEQAAIWCLYSVGHLLAAGLIHFFVVMKGKYIFVGFKYDIYTLRFID